MIQRALSVLLSAILTFGTPAGILRAQPVGSQTSKSEKNAARIKERIARISIESYIRVRMNDGEELRGRLMNRAEDNFRVRGVDASDVAYSDVKSVKVLQAQSAFSNGLTGKRLLIPVLVVGAILGIAIWAASQLK